MKSVPLNTKYRTANYQKYCAIIDDCDFESVNKHDWRVFKRDRNMYAVASIDGFIVPMHCFLLGGKNIDHVDGNGLNNQRNNLRYANASQNAMNKRAKLNGTSIYKGVSRCKDKWQAQIKKNYKNYKIGVYADEKTAALAYNAKAIEMFGEYARINVELI